MTTTKLSNYFMLLVTSIMLTVTSVLKAQSFAIVPQSSNMIISGTSNLHDWEMKVTKITGELGLNSSKQISVLVVKIPVSSIKSGKAIMDGKTYDAFDAKKNPTIVFQLTDASPVKLTEKDAEMTLTGNLTLAGETKKISFKSIGKITKNGDYELKGSLPLKMTDFKIKPPTAFFGSMKTGDEVLIKFDATYKG
jgi:polyisoprenoid-binding protein YceI